MVRAGNSAQRDAYIAFMCCLYNCSSDGVLAGALMLPDAKTGGHVFRVAERLHSRESQIVRDDVRTMGSFEEKIGRVSCAMGRDINNCLVQKIVDGLYL